MSEPTTPATVRPTDLRSARDAVLDTAGPLGVRGAGTAAGWAGDLGGVDTVLDTTAMTGVITHNPADMTVSVRAGTPLRELNDELAGHGQRLALDAARVAQGATVGGLFATGDAGPAGLLYGSLRDLVIGATLVLGDGTVARSGGYVIKNVAGYDLARLLHGSYGAYALLAELVFRLHPTPPRSATLVVDCPLAELTERAAAVLRGPFEPEAVEWVGGAEPGAGTLVVRIVGTEAAVPVRLDRLAAALGTSPDHDGRETADPWGRHATLVRTADDGAVLRVGVHPARLPDVLAALPARAVTAGAGTGIATVVLPADPEVVAAAHATVHAAGGTSVLRARPAGLGAPAWGPAPGTLGVLRSLKRALDPDDRFGPGRFAPWFDAAASADPVRTGR